MIVLAGNNAALLEGLAQALSHTGHRVAVTGSLEDAEEFLASGPLVTVLEGSLLTGAPIRPIPSSRARSRQEAPW